MTTKSDSPLEGTEESANSNSSDNSGNQNGRSTAEQYVTVAQFEKLNGSIEALRRSMQSDKDKGIKALGQRLDGVEGDLRTALQSASKSGLSVNDLLEEMDRAEELEARRASLEVAKMIRDGRFGGTSKEGTAESNAVTGDSVVTELELDVDDMRVKEFRSRKFTSQADAYREAAKLQKQILTTQPSDADQPSRETKRQSTKVDQDSLRKEYDERASKVHGPALLRLKREMREKGLEIS